MFGDEFDNLYRYSEGIPIAKEFLSLGKSAFAMGIISGSSAHVKSLAYKIDREDPRHNNFPDLNYSVYSERRLSPSRTKEKLERILETKGIDASSIDRVKLFRETGGVGRYIDDWVKENFNKNAISNIIQRTKLIAN